MALGIRCEWGLGPDLYHLTARSHNKMLRTASWMAEVGGVDGEVSLQALKNFLYSTDKDVRDWVKAKAFVIDGDTARLNTENLKKLANGPRRMRPRREGVGWTYFIGARDSSGPIKIGSTAGDPQKRLKDLQTGSPEKLEVLAAIPGADHETRLHGEFAPYRLHGEWFWREAPGLRELIDEHSAT